MDDPSKLLSVRHGQVLCVNNELYCYLALGAIILSLRFGKEKDKPVNFLMSYEFVVRLGCPLLRFPTLDVPLGMTSWFVSVTSQPMKSKSASEQHMVRLQL